MKLARTLDNRIGVVRGVAGAENFHDCSAALARLANFRWPVPPGDALIAALPGLRPELERLADAARPEAVAALLLASPVANPSKIVGAPVNYVEHAVESRADPGIAHGRKITGIADMGLFLKANSALVGPGEGVALRCPERRNDHEVELAVVIGAGGTRIAEADALAHVAGYAIGLDMTVRGTEVPSFRKSVDTYAVLGPVQPGDTMIAEIERIGSMRVAVRAA